jgi:hypothetical protein
MEDPIMAFGARLLPTAVVVAGLAIAPASYAAHWHGGGHPNHHGNNAGAAIIGGLIGLGVGAAIASGGGYYAPPPLYYGPPPGYYAPRPPVVYYGY